MKLLTGALAVVPAALLLAGAGGIRAAQTTEAPWRTDWEKAREEARQSSKPLFVVFR